jgi:hypothetical protein
MPRLINPQYTIAAGLTAGALLTLPAIARPMDDVHRSSRAGTVTPRQDLRGEHAMDAARGVVGPYMPKRQDLRGERALDAPPLRMGRPARVPVPSTRTAGDDGDGNGNGWQILGFGLAGMSAAVGSAVGVAHHHRVRARRVVA